AGVDARGGDGRGVVAATIGCAAARAGTGPLARTAGPVPPGLVAGAKRRAADPLDLGQRQPGAAPAVRRGDGVDCLAAGTAAATPAGSRRRWGRTGGGGS